MATTTPRWVAASATTIAVGQPLLPAAPSAVILLATWPAMATLLPGESSEVVPASDAIYSLYTAWATMMH